MSSPRSDTPQAVPLETVPPHVWQDYYCALGKFTHVFAWAESDLNALIADRVSRTSGIRAENFPVIKAILGGMRLKPARDTLKRLMNVTGAAKTTKDEADATLSQISEIQFLRDRIAHNAALPEKLHDEWWFGTGNHITIREWSDIEVIYFTFTMLHDAIHDLEIAPTLLRRTLAPKEWEKDMRLRFPSDEEYQIALSVLEAPWRYKPALLKRRGPKSQCSLKTHQPRS